MIDYTLDAYRQYLEAIKFSYSKILCFSEFLSLDEVPDSFIMIRHDVDRKPGNALKMARLENEIGICSTYYFRIKPHVFKPDIIRAINDYGHEIGYHYECLATAKGNISVALKDFERNLQMLRSIAAVKTIAMHGSPLSPIDNRDLWRQGKRHRLLREAYQILGEVYLDIDYQEIMYISDTGRNWCSHTANIKDYVDGGRTVNIEGACQLYSLLKRAVHPKVVFQVHPERWSDTLFEYGNQLVKDCAINCAKVFVKQKGAVKSFLKYFNK